MDYALLQNFKIYDIKQKVLKKAAPNKDVRNPQGFNNEEKAKAIFLLKKKFQITEKQANNLFYSKSGKYREELLKLDNRENEMIFGNIVEIGYFRCLFGSIRYKKIASEEIITSNLVIVKAIPRLKHYRGKYTNRLISIKLICVDEFGKKINLIYVFGHFIFEDGWYFKAKKHYAGVAKKLNGATSITYINNSKYIIKISKNIEQIMDK